LALLVKSSFALVDLQGPVGQKVERVLKQVPGQDVGAIGVDLSGL
jgi:hypothetical protein